MTQDPFDRSRFARRYHGQVLGLCLAVSSPEDTILMKLRSAKMPEGREKQFYDAVRVYEVQHERPDQEYIRVWTVRPRLAEETARLRKEATID